MVAEGYEYQVHFRAGGNDFSITVTLKSDFPNEKPLLKINPVIVHHWVGSDGAITGAPGLLNVGYFKTLNWRFFESNVFSTLCIQIWDVWCKPLSESFRELHHHYLTNVITVLPHLQFL